MQQTGTKAAGCYKCGKAGHWARDCPAPRSEWVPRPPGAPGGAGGAGGGKATQGGTQLQQQQPGALTGENDPLNEQAAGEQLPGAKLAGAKRKRPKVTLELLKEEQGIPFVFHNFPAAFRGQFKGRGHEAGDLRRLLEMYKRWQERIFPSASFDTFIMAAEKLSVSYMVKHEMREMRMGLLQVAQDAMAPPPVPPEEGGAAEAREGEGYASEGEEGLLGAAALDEGPPVDFDDLIDEEDLIGPEEDIGADAYFQGQQEQQGGPSGAQHAQHAQQAMDYEMDDLLVLPEGEEPNEDELLIAEEVMVDAQQEQQQPTGAPAAAQQAWQQGAGDGAEEMGVGRASQAGEEEEEVLIAPEEDGVWDEPLIEPESQDLQQHQQEQAQHAHQQEEDGQQGSGRGAGAAGDSAAGEGSGAQPSLADGFQGAAAPRPSQRTLDTEAEMLALAEAAPLGDEAVGGTQQALPQVEGGGAGLAQQQQERSAAAGAPAASAEAGGDAVVRLGTQEVVRAAYCQVAALHDSEPPSQMDLGMTEEQEWLALAERDGE